MALTEIGARLRLAGAPAFKKDADKAAGGLGKLAREAGQADRKVGRLTSSMKGLAKGAALGGIGAAAAGAAGAIVLLGDSIKGASDSAESLSKVRTVFGGAAGEIEAFAATAARSLGASRQEALEATGTFGNLFSALGISVKPAAKLSTGLVTLASDLGSFNNVEVDEALLALRSGLLGEAEPLRKFGVSLSASRIEAEALSMGLVQVTKGTKKQKVELTAAQKAQAAYSIIMKDTKVAQGDFARTSGGLANQQKILQAQFRNTKDDIGAGLLPVMVQLATYANDEIVPAINGFVDGFKNSSGAGGEFRDNLVAVRDAAQEAWPEIKATFDATKNVVDFVVRNGDAFVPIIAGVVAYRNAMKSAALWSATMGVNGPKAAAGIMAAGGAAGANNAKLATIAATLGRFAGFLGIIAGLYATNDGVKSTLNEIGGGFKKLGGGDIVGGLKDIVLGELPFKGDAKPKANPQGAGGLNTPTGSAADRVISPTLPGRSTGRLQVQPDGGGAAQNRTTVVVPVQLNGRTLGTAVIEDLEDRVARR